MRPVGLFCLLGFLAHSGYFTFLEQTVFDFHDTWPQASQREPRCQAHGSQSCRWAPSVRELEEGVGVTAVGGVARLQGLCGGGLAVGMRGRGMGALA